MRHRIISAVILAAGLGLTACAGPLGEFHPLYATDSGAKLSRIETIAPDGRTGYLLREQLDDSLAMSRGEPPLYRMTLKLQESRVPRGLRIDNVANRYELTLKVAYTLVSLADRKIVDRGEVSANVTYDSADQAYAGVAAHQDAQKRVAADAAQRLRTTLASHFANPPPTLAAELSGGTPVLGDRLAPQTIRSPGEIAEDQPGARSTEFPAGN